MIGKITGNIDGIYEDHIIVDVAGVGYIVNCSAKVLHNLVLGQLQSFCIQMIVKEDDMTLYGFTSAQDKQCFNLLQTVQGVGARVALNIQSYLTNEQIFTAVMAQDVASFKQVSGIGPKLAERIVNELKSSKQLTFLATFEVVDGDKKISKIALANDSAQSDAIAALVALGYNRRDAFVSINEIIANNENATVEEMIKISLKKFSGN